MTICEIVGAWLKANGYDGLYCPGECCCRVEDLMPCGSPWEHDCRAGHLTACPGDCCPADCMFFGEPGHVHIGGEGEVERWVRRGVTKWAGPPQ